MKLLLIGSGGREAAMAYALKASPKLAKLYVSPGSDGLSEIAEIVPKMNGSECADFCRKNEIELVIFGGETELVEGQADDLRAAGIAVLGASKAAAALEGSKDFLKSVMFDAGVPCAASKSFTELDLARDYLASRQMPIVLKTDGLAGGKGVVICENHDEAQDWLERYLSGEAFGAVGQCVIIEDFLVGDEVSFFVLVDADGNAHPLASARDHKRIFDGDQGPNTGGMGAFTPVAEFTPELQDEVMSTIIAPTLDEMKKRGAPYSGFLFAGLMLTQNGPELLEYNVRLGDPETQVILAALPVDFAELSMRAAKGALPDDMAVKLAAHRPEETRINVVLAAEGYPEAPKKGAAITGLDLLVDGKDYFHAGTKFDEGWKVNGGRVLNVLGKGRNVAEARKNVYEKIEKISFDGVQYRKDIGRIKDE